MKKNISCLNRKNILSGKLKELIPEFYELKDVIENTNDGWHDNESAFEHTLLVMTALEKLFLKASGRLKKTLNQKIDTNTRRILLKVAAIFHDIAKKETIIKDENGFTSCPGHAEMGAKKTEKILERFDLSEKEKQFVSDIIAGHMYLHLLLIPDNSASFQKDFTSMKNRFLNYIYPELILLDYADTIDAGIRKTRPKEFRYRIDFYRREVEKLS